jgi:hypothetical protein
MLYEQPVPQPIGRPPIGRVSKDGLATLITVWASMLGTKSIAQSKIGVPTSKFDAFHKDFRIVDLPKLTLMDGPFTAKTLSLRPHINQLKKNVIQNREIQPITIAA